jgi:glycosyltransferase involved in cell wall biosynthesis
MNKNRIKLGFNGNIFKSKNIRGITRHSLNLIKELHLINQQLDIHIFCSDPIDEFYKNELPYVNFHIIPFRPKILWNLWVLPKLLMLNKISIFHSTNNIGVPLCPSVIKVCTIHDEITHHHRNTFSIKSFWDYINYQIDYFLILKTQKIITVSEYAKKSISKTLKIKPEKIETIYNGTNLTPSTQISLREDFLLYVGGLEQRKNIYFMLKEIESLSQEISIVLVSSLSSATPEVKDLLNNLKYTKVIIKENISDSELTLLYEKAKIVIIPSLDEGFGLPVAESMQLRTPLAISDIEIFKEVSGNHSHFFSPTNTGALKTLLREILTDKNELSKHVENAYHFSMKYSWTEMARNTNNLYMQLMRDKVEK